MQSFMMVSTGLLLSDIVAPHSYTEVILLSKVRSFDPYLAGMINEKDKAVPCLY